MLVVVVAFYSGANRMLHPTLDEAQQVSLQYLFAAAAVWGIGGCLAAGCWDAWDAHVRGLFDGTANYPAGAGSVFDVFVDTTGCVAGCHVCVCVSGWGGGWREKRKKREKRDTAASAGGGAAGGVARAAVNNMTDMHQLTLPPPPLPLLLCMLYRPMARFARWETAVPAFVYTPAQPAHTIFVPTVDTCRYGAVVQACLAVGRPVLLIGGPGVAKSTIINARIHALREQLADTDPKSSSIEAAVLQCSAATSSAGAQAVLESNLVKRSSSLGPPAGSRLVLFVDDLHLPEADPVGAQPVHELLRLLLDRRGIFTRKALQWRRVVDTAFAAAATGGATGGGCSSGSSGGCSSSGGNAISERLTRHMVALAVPPPSEAVLRGICSAVLGGFLSAHFTPGVRDV